MGETEHGDADDSARRSLVKRYDAALSLLARTLAPVGLEVWHREAKELLGISLDDLEPLGTDWASRTDGVTLGISKTIASDEMRFGDPDSAEDRQARLQDLFHLWEWFLTASSSTASAVAFGRLANAMETYRRHLEHEGVLYVDTGEPL